MARCDICTWDKRMKQGCVYINARTFIFISKFCIDKYIICSQRILCISKVVNGQQISIAIRVVDPEWFFSDPNLDPSFQLVSDSTWIFSNILNINFNLYSRLISVLGCILWRDISFFGKFKKRGIYIFKLNIFVEKLSNLIRFIE